MAFFSDQLGSALGAWLGGHLYDQTGSYALIWAVSVGLGLFAALVHLPIDERTVKRLAH